MSQILQASLTVEAYSNKLKRLLRLGIEVTFWRGMMRLWLLPECLSRPHTSPTYLATIPWLGLYISKWTRQSLECHQLLLTLFAYLEPGPGSNNRQPMPSSRSMSARYQSLSE